MILPTNSFSASPFTFVSAFFLIVSVHPAYTSIAFKQTVGCDQELGSTRKLDACGVCGGDNSTCQPIRLNNPDSSSSSSSSSYRWVMDQPGPCVPKCPSATLQTPPTEEEDDKEDSLPWPAYQMSKPFCIRLPSTSSLAHQNHQQQTSQMAQLDALPLDWLRSRRVSEHLCDANEKPNVQLRKCRTSYRCPARWVKHFFIN